jgi:hypothetical protein
VPHLYLIAFPRSVVDAHRNFEFLHFGIQSKLCDKGKHKERLTMKMI